MKMKRFTILVFSLLILAILPIVLWLVEPSKRLDVAIINKTVADGSYRKHLGLTWLLNHLKYQGSSGQPYENDQIHPSADDYSKYDVIYLADTYGIQKGEKIHGGLEEAEWTSIVSRLMDRKKSLLIADYNSFAPPTSEEVRASVTDFLGLNWTGWIGCYFEELDYKKNEAIPQRLVDSYDGAWSFGGEGFILLNNLDGTVVVLEGEKHIRDGGINLSFTEEGEELFGLKRSSNYADWFDIITVKNQATVLADYAWNLSAQGEELLARYDIPTEFAAVIRSEHGSSSAYYFAGDFTDLASAPYFYQNKGLPAVYQIAQKYSDSAFYWSTYVPMMTVILEEFDQRADLPDDETSVVLGYNTRIEKKTFEILKDDKWEEFKIKGVNIGMGKPGAFPGEAAITEDEYYRWLEAIGEMNANTIRVYTLHPPAFYAALKEYNENHEEKIYLIHGVWINEEQLEGTLDAFTESIQRDFQEEMKRIVDVIHGKGIVAPVPGHASGVYVSDISEYVIAWILGIEWYPFMVENTNKEHGSIGDYQGKYFETKNANPFEHWLAKQMDVITKYEIENYRWIRPISFTNWPTTDILDHPSDSSNHEDLVSVDPNVIYSKEEAELTKQFASYHVYPYYPDFLNNDDNYRTYVDHRGDYNNYAGYLAELHAAHRLPILVAEFGIPASRGKTHDNPFGWNQGFMSEVQQGEIVGRMYEDIIEEDLLGGLIFTWQDEWFKRTWNTMDYDNPDRRPYWSNAQTNEQQFGLLSFDRHKILVDGDTREWEASPLYYKNEGELSGLYVDHDERYLYLRLDVRSEDYRDAYPLLLLDVVADQGNHGISGMDQLRFKDGVDFLINLHPDESRIVIDPYYDFYAYLYAYQQELLEPKRQVPEKNSGQFSPIRYMLNKPYLIAHKDIIVPLSFYETGKLRKGNANPASEQYDSLADYALNDEGGLEVRIPWLLLQAKDPGRKEFIGDLYADGIDAAAFIEEIRIAALYLDGQGKILDSFPAVEDGELPEMHGYAWDNWDQPLYEERLKQSYRIIKELFSEY